MSSIKQPIPLVSFFQYYLQDDQALKRPKKQLIQEMKDLITISQFLQNKIPNTIKNIKQNIREQTKSVKSFNQTMRMNVRSLTQNQKYQSSNYNQAAFDQMTNFTYFKQASRDYLQKTIAQKQFKLKFLESQNLPQDFIWIKSSIRSNAHKDYSFYSSFNTKLNLIQVINRKYRILIGMNVQNKKYVWSINRIELRLNRQVNQLLSNYFQQNIKPALKIKLPLGYQQNMLACIDSFSYFLQLIQINRHICQITSSQFFSQNIKYHHNGKIYELNFSRPENFGDAQIIINENENLDITLKLIFTKKRIQGRLYINQLIVLKAEKQFIYQNPNNLLTQFQTLVQYSHRYNKCVQYLDRDVNQFNPYVFIKLNGVYWISTEQNWMKGSNYFNLNQDGIYAGYNNRGYFTYVEFSQRILSSRKVSTPFLNKMVKIVEKFQIIFFIIQIIESILQDNKQAQCQYDHSMIINNKICLYFRKKVCAQDLTIKNEYRLRSNEQQAAFNAIKFLAQFSADFQQLVFYNFRDPDQKSVSQRQQWKPHFNPNYKPMGTYLQIDKVIEVIKYMQDNVIFKYVLQRKLKYQTKQQFNVKF